MGDGEEGTKSSAPSTWLEEPEKKTKRGEGARTHFFFSLVALIVIAVAIILVLREIRKKWKTPFQESSRLPPKVFTLERKEG
jgi:cell division protein FtsN